MPFEVFALCVRRFLQVEVPRVLSAPWQTLELHVDNRCSFCEYLGEPRPASATTPDLRHTAITAFRLHRSPTTSVELPSLPRARV